MSSKTTHKRKSSNTCTSNPIEAKLKSLLPSTRCLQCIVTLKAHITKYHIPNCSISKTAFTNLVNTIDPSLLIDLRPCDRTDISRLKNRLKTQIRHLIYVVYMQRKPESNKETLKRIIKLYFELCTFEANHYEKQIPNALYSASNVTRISKKFKDSIQELKQTEKKSLKEIETSSFTDTSYSQFNKHPSSSAVTSNVKRTTRSNTDSLQETIEDGLSASSSSTKTTSTSNSSSISTQTRKISQLFLEFKLTLERLSMRRRNLITSIGNWTGLSPPPFDPDQIRSILRTFPKQYQGNKKLHKRSLQTQLSTLSKGINYEKVIEAPDIVIASIKSYCKLREFEGTNHILPKIPKKNENMNCVKNYKKDLDILKQSSKSLIEAIAKLEEELS